MIQIWFHKIVTLIFNPVLLTFFFFFPAMKCNAKCTNNSTGKIQLLRYLYYCWIARYSSFQCAIQITFAVLLLPSAILFFSHLYLLIFFMCSCFYFCISEDDLICKLDAYQLLSFLKEISQGLRSLI